MLTPATLVSTSSSLLLAPCSGGSLSSLVVAALCFASTTATPTTEEEPATNVNRKRNRIVRFISRTPTISTSIRSAIKTTASCCRPSPLSPRARACMYMAASMALHYGGYEFARNAGLALFTSDAGFPGASAFPLANGLTSPISLALLILYGRLLEAEGGPRAALRLTTAGCMAFVLITAAVLWQCSGSLLNSSSSSSVLLVPAAVTRFVIGLVFLFNNAYVFLLASQQWSFTDSIVTPNEGAQWFGAITGVCSIVCTVAASAVPFLLPHTGLVGLYAITAVTLAGTWACGDRAYALAQQHGFDPGLQREAVVRPTKIVGVDVDGNTTAAATNTRSRILTAIALFRRVPTLAALFAEGMSFQILSTILNVSMVRALKLEIPNDMERSAYTGRFYALVSGVSAVLQFVVLPMGLKRLEPKHLWRVMPILPLLVSLVQVWPGSSVSLHMLAGALFLTKVLDYSLRIVVYNMAFQPLDFESRFVGKEIIGVFGSRFGRSGMSLLLSGLMASGLLSRDMRPLSYLSILACTAWISSTWWLSTLLPSKADAQRTFEERQRKAEVRKPQQEKKL